MEELNRPAPAKRRGGKPLPDDAAEPPSGPAGPPVPDASGVAALWVDANCGDPLDFVPRFSVPIPRHAIGEDPPAIPAERVEPDPNHPVAVEESMTEKRVNEPVPPIVSIVREAVPNGQAGAPGVPGIDGPVLLDLEQYAYKPANRTDEAILDEFEKLERDNILTEDEGDEPGAKEEVAVIPVVAKLPKFARFRANPATIFDMWATVDEAGMDRTVIVVTKDFAPTLEEVVELRRVRFYETVTTDGVVRLAYSFLPAKDEKNPNSWITSKTAAMELALTSWATMRSVKKLAQYTHRRANKDYGVPQFSGMTRGELIHHALRKPGLLVEDETHPFYRKAADLDDE